MKKSIRDIAQNLRRSPEDLLQTIREAGIDKSSVDDSLTPSERNKLLHILAPERKGGSGKWAGSGPSPRAREGASVASMSKGAARTVSVRVRKRSIRLSQKNPLGPPRAPVRAPGTGVGVGASADTDAPAGALAPAQKSAVEKTTPGRKRVYSAETRKIIQGDARQIAQGEAENVQALPGALPGSAPARSDDSAVVDPGVSDDTGAREPGDGGVATHPARSPGKESGKLAAVDASGILEKKDAGDKRPAKGEAPPRKRPSTRRDRLDLTESEDEYTLQENAESEPAASASAYEPSSYLHIKKSFRKRRKVKTQTSAKRENLHGFQAPTGRVSLRIGLPQQIAVRELALRLHIKLPELMAHIRTHKIDLVDDTLDQVSAALVVESLGHTVELLESDNPLVRARAALNYQGEMTTVPPVVTIMGHVDHGKTTLVDCLRHSHLAGSEYGAITQHIGAYRVPTEHGSCITFLDTPGHAAFANMRERGARVTDIVVVVVAADDGVKPQTVESIEYAKRYQIPIVVAVNKIDKDNANPERIRTAMAEHEVVPEAWGGNNQFVEISALKRQGIDKLLEAIHLQAEMIGKKVPSAGDGFGYIIESGQRKGLGITATILLRKGAMKKGQVVSAGLGWGRIRFLLDEDNKRISELTPGLPATLIGLNAVVEAGSEIFVTTEALAREIEGFTRQQSLAVPETELGELDADALFADLEKEARIKTLNLYIKTDVQGSTDAVRKVLEGLEYPDFRINIVSCRQGGVYESDVQTAASTGSIIIGFNVSVDNSARRLAEGMSVQIHLHRSVYELFEFVDGLVRAQASPVLEYTKVGEAEVREVFRSSAFGSVAGCMIVDGAVHRNDVIRVIRDSKQIFEGRLDSLRRFKDDVQVVNMGSECGIAVKKFDDLRQKDIIEAFKTREMRPERDSEREAASV